MYNYKMNLGLMSKDCSKLMPSCKVINSLLMLVNNKGPWNPESFDYCVKESNTEPTLVVTLTTVNKLEDSLFWELCEIYEQDCIAIKCNEEKTIIGPKAEAWSPFNEDYFISIP